MPLTHGSRTDANFLWAGASHYPTLPLPWPPRPLFFQRVTVVRSRHSNKCLPKCRQLSRKCAPIPLELSRYESTRNKDIALAERFRLANRGELDD